MSKTWAGGSTRAWRRTRAYVLARDGYRCRLKLPGCTGTATHAHHTRGRAVTGDDPRYIVAACAHCNLKTGDPTRATTPRAQPRTAWTTQMRGSADDRPGTRQPDQRLPGRQRVAGGRTRQVARPTPPHRRTPAGAHGRDTVRRDVGERRTSGARAGDLGEARDRAGRRVTLVTGPPCAGKTHYVRAHARPGDVVLDQDDLGPAEMRRHIALIHSHTHNVWIIRCRPGPAARAALAAELGAQHIHLHPDTSTLLARAQQRPHPRRTTAAIHKWLTREAQAGQGQGRHRPRAQPRTRWTAS